MRCLSPQRQSFQPATPPTHWSRWQRATAFLPRMVIASTSQPGGLICYTIRFSTRPFAAARRALVRWPFMRRSRSASAA